MIDEVTRMEAFAADIATRRADRMLRGATDTELDADVASGDVAEQYPVFTRGVNGRSFVNIPASAKELALITKRFFQDADNVLYIAPLAFYPGLLWAEGLDGIEAPSSSALWVRLEYTLIPTSFGPDATGWSGGISGSKSEMIWSAENLTAANQIFPGVQTSSMPPNNTLIWHGRIGTTDASKRFTLTFDYLDQNQPLIIPPL